MKRSLNEISGMVLKAARGANVPLGHCEDLAVAAGYIAATDPVMLDGLPDVMQHAMTPPEVTIEGASLIVGEGSSVMTAPFVLDGLRGGMERIVVISVQQPHVIFALCAAHQVGVSHQFDGDDLILSPKSETPAVPPCEPATVAQSTWDALNALAAKTYGPATEASRLAGAGAGLTDND